MPTYTYIFALFGLVLALLAIPLILRRVPPNALYGLRVPATFRDDSVWYDANAASGRDMVIFAVVVFLAAFLLPAAGVRDFAMAIAWIVIAGGGALFVAIIGWRRANRMFRERRPS